MLFYLKILLNTILELRASRQGLCAFRHRCKLLALFSVWDGEMASPPFLLVQLNQGQCHQPPSPVLCSSLFLSTILSSSIWRCLKTQKWVNDAKPWLSCTQISAGKFARLLWVTHSARSICSVTVLLCPSTFTFTPPRLKQTVLADVWEYVNRLWDSLSQSGHFVSLLSSARSVWWNAQPMQNSHGRSMPLSARARYNQNTWQQAMILRFNTIDINTTNTQECTDTIYMYILKLVTTFNILEANPQHFLPASLMPHSHTCMNAESGTCHAALLLTQFAKPTSPSYKGLVLPTCISLRWK